MILFHHLAHACLVVALLALAACARDRSHSRGAWNEGASSSGGVSYGPPPAGHPYAEGAVRRVIDRASVDLGCPADAIRVQTLAGGGHLVTGCEQRAEYRCWQGWPGDLNPIRRAMSPLECARQL